MNAPTWTPNEIALRLSQLSRALDDLAGDLEGLERDAVVKRHTYELAFARAFLGQESGSVDARKQAAVLATAAEKLEAETAEAVLRAARTRIGTLKTQIETGRSLNALMRSEMALAGVGT
ncbi:hypothetical protein Ssi03_51030 [Sphaerisporangium siamense]|uniref:Uncharacterized protein n=1 Tax=Sphaerisporangium siamense TaxID=795645 RepID=A0A7W7D8E1_9ACTN|nr:hypothetical protein [Sphaerisporangium siamense]MBB4702193.1 hypothetical protein [Sphaerisporangium siamense]GII87113.1 hypothetical protein Ssi03_51030 [Sphaerisporangium siamense]